MKKEVYNITIDKILAAKDRRIGINQIAYTDNPAIQIKGLAFSEQKEATLTKGDYIVSKFNSVDTMKMRVASPALIPDKEIFRKDEETGEEFFVKFDAESIELLVSNFQSKNVDTKFNVNHTERPAPAYVMESWIIESVEDKAYAKYGFTLEDVPLGSWMVVSQITDKEFFLNEILEKKQYGYSVEGFFDLVLQLTQQNKEEKMNKEKFSLPKGKHLIDGKFYEIDAKGALVKVSLAEDKEELEDEKKEELEEKEKDSVFEDSKEEEELEEDKKEELEDDKKEELEDDKKEELEDEVEGEVVEEKEEVSEYYSKEEVDDKFSNLIDMISKLESMLEEGKEEEMEEKEDERPVSLSAKFSAMKELNKK